MGLIAKILIAIIALEHFYFMYFEMFQWETIGARTFRSKIPDFFKITKSLAMNQGIYNGFLAAGLVWSLLIQDGIWAKNIAIFFLICVVAAGLIGAMSVSKRIFYVQAIPAILALLIIIFIK